MKKGDLIFFILFISLLIFLFTVSVYIILYKMREKRIEKFMNDITKFNKEKLKEIKK